MSFSLNAAAKDSDIVQKMAETIGIAGSIVSFVGLVGQILQGCIAIRSILDDFKDASTDFRDLRHELLIFQAGLDSLRITLGHEVNVIDAVPVRQVLEFGHKCINDLRNLVEKLDERSAFKARISAVWRRNKIQKHVSKLQRARLMFVSAQMTLSV